MTLQQMSFLEEPEEKRSIVFRGGSRANRIAVLESVRRLEMNVTYGPKCGELLAKLSPDGLWLKTYGDYYQAKMDGSFLEFSGTLPTWGTMWRGELRAQPQLEPFIEGNESQSLLGTLTANNRVRSERFRIGRRPNPAEVIKLIPTITASDYKGGCLRKNSQKQLSNLKEFVYTFSEEQTRSIYLNPQFCEELMGFPKGWTELEL